MSGRRAARRIACVELPGQALQILAQEDPSLRDRPAVALDRDDPNGRVLAVNRRAAAAGVRPGMRHAAALSRVRDLVARALTPAQEREARDALIARLRNAGPSVETSRERPGVYWVDASGLPDARLAAWCDALHAGLRDAGWVARIAVGFSRAGTLGGVLTSAGPRVFATPAEEDAELVQVALHRLGLPPGQLARLERLGLRTLGDLRALDHEALRRRFDPDLLAMLARLRVEDPAPLRPPKSAPVEEAEAAWDAPALRVPEVVAGCEGPLTEALNRLLRRGLVPARVELTLRLDARPAFALTIPLGEALETFAPLGELLQLSLERDPPDAGVHGVHVALHGRPPERVQQTLFSVGRTRDLAAGTRALERVRASLGEDAVFGLEVGEGHRPEDRTRRIRIARLRAPRPEHGPMPVLVRQLVEPPEPLPYGPWDAPEGVFLNAGGVAFASGPWSLDGGWWDAAWARDYFYVETTDGQLFWVFQDRHSRAWFLHGRIA